MEKPAPKAGEELAEEEGIPVPGVEPLARRKVRLVGETVAAVVAETRVLAEDAADAGRGRLGTARRR